MPQKQHYVPEVYLKHFTKKGIFFSAKPKSINYKFPLKKYPGQVCYLKDFYNLTNHEKQIDYIEKKAFNYESEKLNLLFSNFKNRTPILTPEHHSEIIDIYLSLKHRNPYFRRFLKEFNVESILNKQIEELKEKKNIIEKLSQKPFEQLMAEIKFSILSDTELPDWNHKNAIVQHSEGLNIPINEAKEKLLLFQLTILEPLNAEDYFITSDNPGFSVLEDVKIYNTNFGNFDVVGFPINSKQLLTFYKRKDLLDKSPHVQYLKIPTTSVFIINECSAINSIEYIFCENREYLDKFTKQYQSIHPPNPAGARLQPRDKL